MRRPLFCRILLWPLQSWWHVVRGLTLATWHAGYGYFAPTPYSTLAIKYYEKPFSTWKGMFLGTVWELAGQKLNRDPPAVLDRKTTQQSRLESQAHGSPPHSDLLDELGVTREVLYQAGETTRERITTELTAHLTVYFLISGFIFTVLVAPQERTSPRDLFGLLAGLAFITSTVAIGLYARLMVMFNWAPTTAALYRLIVNWEAAMSGNQLILVTVLALSLACAMAAVWEVYSVWVFVVLIVTVAITFVWFFLYFWSSSMWCTDAGVKNMYAKLFYAHLTGVDNYPEQKKVSVENIRDTFFWQVDRYLLGGGPEPEGLPALRGAASPNGAY